MKKRVLQIATGIAFAGMLALSGCGSTQTTGAEAPETTDVETVEEVEVPMQENETSCLTGAEGFKQITNYKTLEDFEKSLSSDDWVAHVYLKGYKGDVLLVDNKYENKDEPVNVVYSRDTSDSDDKAKNYCSNAKFYTVVDGAVRCIGRLNPRGSGGDISITDNGIIFATGDETIESYLVSKDGKDIVHKDFLNYDSLWGYYNESNDPSQKVEFTNDQKLIDKIRTLKDSAKIVEFHHPNK